MTEVLYSATGKSGRNSASGQVQKEVFFDMRNLKKVLSLSLALVMLLGLMVVGAGAATTFADLKDKDEISENYAEAVDLLTALGVLEGNENDEFMPTGTLTREAAAKIVAYLALGVDAAEKLSVTSAPFKDVAANRWSAGYIAYCANVGIIDGDGKGSFYPTQTVTGYQFAKMLLGVLGYGVKDEYVGTNWALNVAKDGVTVGLFSRLGNVGNTAATREEAAQLAFNALTANMVTYSELFGTYSAYAPGVGQQQLLGTKAEKVFEVETATEQNGYGYDVHYWHYIGAKKAITDTYLSGTILGTETSAGLTYGAIYKNYELNALGGTDNKAKYDRLGVEVYVNGTKRLDDVDPDTLRGSDTKPFELYNGYTATIVDEDNDGDADKVVVVIEYLAEVTKVNAATASADRSVNFTVTDNTGKVTVTNVETEDFEKGDLILVVPSSDNKDGFKTPLEMKKAEVVTATVSAYYKSDIGKANGSVTAGGVKYSYNGIYAHTSDALGYTLATSTGASGYSLGKGTYNFYLDTNGNVIGVKPAENAIADFAYITAVGHNAFAQYNTVQAILSDGTVGTYTVSAQSSAKAFDGSNPTNDSKFAAVGQIYGYTLTSNNEIVLTELTGDYGAAESLTANTGYGTPGGGVSAATNKISSFSKGYATILYGSTGSYNSSAVYATDETVFIYNNGGKVTRFVGKNNAPTINSAVDATIAYHTVGTSTTKYADVVVINAAPAVTMSDNYVYLLSTTIVGYSTDVNGAPVYYYNVIKGGEKTTIASATILGSTGVYLYSLDEAAFTSDDLNMVESGKYTLGTGATVVSGYVAVKSNDNVVVLADGKQIAYADIDITNVTGATESGVTLQVGDPITVVYGATAGNTYVAKSIYVTGANAAWLNGFTVTGPSAADGQLISVEKPTATSFVINAKTSLNGTELGTLATDKSASAVVSVHASMADANADANPITTAELATGTTYFVRVENTVGGGTVFNVFTVSLTITP